MGEIEMHIKKPRIWTHQTYVKKKKKKKFQGTYPGCICSWDFQQTNDNPQAGIHWALTSRLDRNKLRREKKERKQLQASMNAKAETFSVAQRGHISGLLLS